MTGALKELDSEEALVSHLKGNRNVVVCFSATWCGPCKASKPTLDKMAQEYEQDHSKDVKFGIIYEHNLGDSIHNYRVNAFPTYVLFVKANEVDRVRGVNFDGIAQMIDKAGCAPDFSTTTGYSLGGGGGGGGGDGESSTSAPLSVEEARARRLAKLGGGMETGASTGGGSGTEKSNSDDKMAVDDDAAPAAAVDDDDDDGKKPAAVGDKDDGEAVPMETSDADGSQKDGEGEVEMVDTTTDLDQEVLQTLTETMGFSLLRAQKGLLYGNGSTVESSVEWITQHQDDDDIDEPIQLQPKGGTGVAQSYKCNECGKILSNMANLELHANKTGHSDFEESTESVKPLTPEEKARKIEEIKMLLKAKREEREGAEKVDDVEREKQRREMGKLMSKTREQMEVDARKREARLRKKEKEDFKKERARIRAELARDKAERAANKGKLSSKLGVGGYNPDGIQYDVDDEDAGGDANETGGSGGGGGGGGGDDAVVVAKKPKTSASAGRIDEYIQKVSSYRAGGDGGKCLKVLGIYVSNLCDNPTEEKFRTINMENKAFKAKVKPFVGAKQILLAVGFAPNDTGDALVLPPEAMDAQVLRDTKKKLQDALAAYG